VKKGNDLILEDGRIIAHKVVTSPPWKRRSYAYISDTAYKPDIVDILKGIDLLYHEATFGDEDSLLAKKTLHSTSSEAATIARAAGVGKLLLGHFSSRYKSLDKLLEDARKIFPQSFIVNDGEVYSVERQRKPLE
jgi:ribonuclease Z